MTREAVLLRALKNIQHMLKQEQTYRGMDILKGYVDRVIRQDELEEEQENASAEV